MTIEVVSVFIACAYLLVGLHGEGALEVVWIDSVFVLPIFWLFARRLRVVRFLVNVLVLVAFFYVRSTYRFILSKAEFIRVSDLDLESWDDPYVVLFGLFIAMDVYLLARVLIGSRLWKTRVEKG